MDRSLLVPAPSAAACLSCGRRSAADSTGDPVFTDPGCGDQIETLFAPRITEDGLLAEGVIVHGDVEVPRIAPSGPDKSRGPLSLRDHGNAVRHRDRWILPKP